MDKISELNIRAALRFVCERYELTADYQQGNAALCWRVSFAESFFPLNKSAELVGTTRRELYDAIHAFRHGMEFAKSFSFEGR